MEEREGIYATAATATTTCGRRRVKGACIMCIEIPGRCASEMRLPNSQIPTSLSECKLTRLNVHMYTVPQGSFSSHLHPQSSSSSRILANCANVYAACSYLVFARCCDLKSDVNDDSPAICITRGGSRLR